MKGFLYKDLYNSRVSFAAIAIIQAVIVVVLILNAIVTSEITLSEGFLMDIVNISLYLLAYISSTLCLNDCFKKDEIRQWQYFSMTVPDGIEGIVYSKYIVVLLSQIIVTFSCFVVDSICMVICPTKTSDTIIIWILLMMNMIKLAIEIPCTILAGSRKGASLGNAVFMVLIIFIILYVLFGDISMFFEEAVLEKIKKALTEGLAMWILSLLPWVTILLFWISSRFTIAFYRKGVERIYD